MPSYDDQVSGGSVLIDEITPVQPTDDPYPPDATQPVGGDGPYSTEIPSSAPAPGAGGGGRTWVAEVIQGAGVGWLVGFVTGGPSVALQAAVTGAGLSLASKAGAEAVDALKDPDVRAALQAAGAGLVVSPGVAAVAAVSTYAASNALRNGPKNPDNPAFDFLLELLGPVFEGIGEGLTYVIVGGALAYGAYKVIR